MSVVIAPSHGERHQVRNDLQGNVQRNLATLVESCRSVADMCRKIDVNRQQFNKYLAGQHVPSQKILQKIARYFMMEAEDLFRPPADFKQFYEGFENELPIGLRASAQFNHFLPLAKASAHALDDYLGVYYRYHNSSIYKGRILRSVTCLYRADTMVQYVTVERFPLQDGSGKTGYSFTYHGFCLLLGDRLFMVDFEGKQRNEITFSILTPQHRRPIRFLHGLVTGVASSSYRQPFSTRLTLNYVEKGLIRKRHLRAATVLLPDDLSLPVEVREYMTGDNAAIVWGGQD
ncbi:helix-turn-helix transcriptional regulator [Pseudomonas sp. PS01298]|uniref:helix-turn-helix transcriptional regulator n=1 Tax=Pseudomonas sp. PS01298 TaxID=2991434 RepID=UPI00249C6739|nr:helix-turn-helix transcriptional regulator [Pseudomonas sp. PS01298]